jgi:oxygen-independent coproporphyrinogen III oxidase
MAGIYIHIPFCKQACYYCDFHFSTNKSIKKEMVSCIVHELEIQRNYLKNLPINTIYFGGGTPSLLDKDEIDYILNTIRQNFNIKSDVEITLEANPDDLTETTLQNFFASGINRLSIGVQSFHNHLLTFLHRAHNATAAVECITLARHAGFKNISIDLIYAIPEETDDEWVSDIQQTLQLEPQHISCYSLTIEEKTVFGKWSASGKLKIVDDEVAARHLELLMDTLEAAGYDHYEISNFAKPGFYSRHNSSYWNQEHYLGVGPSAHSFNGISRQFNISNNHLYIKSLQSGIIPFEVEVLSPEDKINEYLLTTLRTSKGADLESIQKHYGVNLLQDAGQYISTLLEKKLATLEMATLRLTKKGKLLADKIASDLFVLPI